ncbi:MAG: hypothetical protein ACTSSI_18415 [Candidatus Helarchaeota archaeon]
MSGLKNEDWNFDIEKLKRILPKLIRENDEIKGAIITALSGVIATGEDEQALRGNGQAFRGIARRNEQALRGNGQAFRGIARRNEQTLRGNGQAFRGIARRNEQTLRGNG